MFKNWFKRENITITPQVLDLKPDDIVVLSYDYTLSEEQIKQIKKLWETTPFNKHKAILLEGGGKLSVLKGL